MKKWICALLAVCTVFLLAAPCAAQSGMCGNSVEWCLTGDTLTISANGKFPAETYDYTNEIHAPWYKNRTEIRHIYVKTGVVKIGSYAFAGCVNLKDVVFEKFYEENGVKISTVICDCAFLGCTSLKNVFMRGADSLLLEGESGHSELAAAYLHMECADEATHFTTYTVRPTRTEPGYTEYSCSHGVCYRDDFKPCVGWVYEDGEWYYVNKNGTSPSGWVKLGGNWYYFLSGGKMKYGWLKDNGKWYWLGSKDSGKMATGWQKIGGTWYHFASSGAMNTGWFKDGGKWYWLGSKDSGKMATGWQKIGGAWYYFNASGAMQTGWLKSGGVWYWLGAEDSGKMVTGWQKIGGVWYYFNSTGDMRTGWLKDGNTWYYLKTSGAMAKSETLTVNGTDYVFAASGAML